MEQDFDKAPKRVKVIGKTYSIDYMDKVDEEDNLGEHDITTQKIKIRKEQHFEALRDTVMHEVMHAIDEQMSLKLKESQVHALASGLLQLIRENPKFLRFLMEAQPKIKKELK
jgi:hypothetical protein